MVAFSRFQRLTGAFPVLGAALAGIGVAAVVALMPAAGLESAVWRSGIAALVPAAEPPLGATARAVLVLAGGGAAAAVAWAALYLLFGRGGFLDGRRDTTSLPDFEALPVLRRGDAHPDAPPRRPMSAADLGTPLMEVAPAPAPAARPSVVEQVLPAERALPADLDQRLAAFDPDAIAAAVAPQTAERPVIKPAVALAPGERLETFELTPVVRFGTEHRPEAGVAPSLDTLLRRLEHGAGRRPARG